ncbi:hypothetical protein WJX74_004455 [Apatococcus lobatus]|uniref:S1 motif domain-containing protein n=2 Tax=Apatococcus TaxID=904362 RepID=A0AAW1SWL3_9CHLO
MGFRSDGSVLAVESCRAVLAEAPSPFQDSGFVCVGDRIETDVSEGFLRGHGTYVIDGVLYASVCGLKERVNKLISVRPLKQRYAAEIGDVVVGRVTEVAGKRWRVDLKSRQDAALMLSAVNLPGGIQRRRTMEDELNMRLVFEEGDLISAEVQSLHADGQINLQTRSSKYGRLVGGQLVEVPATLIKRQKFHFHHLEDLGVDMIVGCNGGVWVGPHDAHKSADTQDGGHGREEAVLVMPTMPSFTPQQRGKAARVANAVRVLAILYLPVHSASIQDTCQAAMQLDLGAADMLKLPFIQHLAEQEVQRRQQDEMQAD